MGPELLQSEEDVGEASPPAPGCIRDDMDMPCPEESMSRGLLSGPPLPPGLDWGLPSWALVRLHLARAFWNQTWSENKRSAKVFFFAPKDKLHFRC